MTPTTPQHSLRELESERDRLKKLRERIERSTEDGLRCLQLETEIANYRRWIRDLGGDPDAD